MNDVCIDFPEVIISVRNRSTGKVWTVNQRHPAEVPDGLYEISHDSRLIFLGRGTTNPITLHGNTTLLVTEVRYLELKRESHDSH
jgi:carbohydrate-binding DOMON domain-containing protein